MPLQLQALLPFAAIVAAALAVRFRPARRTNGVVAAAGAGAAATIALIELVRLAPGERVDSSYLSTFPYAELTIHSDALSLSFAVVTASTACLLMLVRVVSRGDRRDPWFNWLIATAAALSVELAGNLLLLYVAFQLLTLAWSGALDEAAPRRRWLRFTQQASDLGLLFVAGLTIQSVGTSAYSGVPSDTIGPAVFLVALLPALTRIGALAMPLSGPQAPVLFEPAVAWAAPAGYLVLRLLSLTGGRVPTRTIEVALFAAGLVAAGMMALLAAVEGLRPSLPVRLVSVLALTALAISALGTPLSTLGAGWLWLLLIPLTGLTCVRLGPRSLARVILLLNLALVPPGAAFIGLWLAGQGLIQSTVLSLVPLALVALVVAAGVASVIALDEHLRIDLPSGWGLALLAAGAFPGIALVYLVAPAATAVRAIPGGTFQVNPLGITAGTRFWPAAPVCLAVAAALFILLERLGTRLPLRRSSIDVVARLATIRLPKLRLHNLPDEVTLRRAYWAVFAAALAAAALAR